MRAHENPFRSQRVLEVRYRPQEGNWAELLDRLERLAYRAAILGAEGSGKTTLLEDLQGHLERRGLRPVLILHHGERPRVDWREPGALGDRDVALVDGADLLGRAEWWRLRWMARRWGGLVVTSHTREMLPALLTCRTSPGLLGEIIEQLVPDRRAVEGVAVDELFARHRGNVREALRELYDRLAEAKEG